MGSACRYKGDGLKMSWKAEKGKCLGDTSSRSLFLRRRLSGDRQKNGQVGAQSANVGELGQRRASHNEQQGEQLQQTEMEHLFDWDMGAEQCTLRCRGDGSLERDFAQESSTLFRAVNRYHRSLQGFRALGRPLPSTPMSTC
jgi:hypothetical protein